MVFNLFVELGNKDNALFLNKIKTVFPDINKEPPQNIIDIFNRTLCYTLASHTLPYPSCNVLAEKEEWIIAVENFFDHYTKQAVYTVCDWLKAISDQQDFDMHARFPELTEILEKEKSSFPLLPELIIETRKKNIDIAYHSNTNTIRWGYGCRIKKNRNLIFNSDNPLDIHVLENSVLCLQTIREKGFPVPSTSVCLYENDLNKQIKKIGFPVIARTPDNDNNILKTDIDNIKTLRKIFSQFQENNTARKDKGIIIQEQLRGNHYHFLLLNGIVFSGLETRAYSENTKEATLIFEKNPENSLPEENIQILQQIAGIFDVHALEVQIITDNETISWNEQSYHIINISADPNPEKYFRFSRKKNPSLLRHFTWEILGKIIKSHRIPIICGNNIGEKFYSYLLKYFSSIDENINIGYLNKHKMLFNTIPQVITENHDINCLRLLENNQLNLVIINHDEEQLMKWGINHIGADMVFLFEANHIEYALMRDLLPDGIMLEIKKNDAKPSHPYNLIISTNLREIYNVDLEAHDDIDIIIFEVIQPYLQKLIYKYDE